MAVFQVYPHINQFPPLFTWPLALNTKGTIFNKNLFYFCLHISLCSLSWFS